MGVQTATASSLSPPWQGKVLSACNDLPHWGGSLFTKGIGQPCSAGAQPGMVQQPGPPPATLKPRLRVGGASSVITSWGDSPTFPGKSRRHRGYPAESAKYLGRPALHLRSPGSPEAVAGRGWPGRARVQGAGQRSNRLLPSSSLHPVPSTAASFHAVGLAAHKGAVC